jgi:type I restriction enzyme S subunit
MELKKGYKQTEVGVIPSDWEVKKLGEIGNFKNGINKSNEDFGFGFPFANLMDVFGKSSIQSNKEFGLINSNEAERKLYNLVNGDVLFIRSSVKPSGVGLTCVIEENLPNTVFSGFIIRYRDVGVLTKEYKRHCFYEQKFRNSLIGSSTVSANTNINQEALKRLVLIIPPKSEQTAIATALSDADALITSLEKLIAKKRNIKQGAMQQLLRPKKGWVVKRLGDVASVVGGGTPRTTVPEYWNGNINWFTPTEIGESKYVYSSERKITAEGFKNCSGQMLPKGTILLTSRAGIGDLGILMVEACTNQGFQSLIAQDQVNNEFLYYLMSTLKNVLLQNASGSTFLEISPSKVKAIEVAIPSHEEQNSIATILSDMDSELMQLESKLGKAKSIKQGMMQNLLTGKIRLV